MRDINNDETSKDTNESEIIKMIKKNVRKYKYHYISGKARIKDDGIYKETNPVIYYENGNKKQEKNRIIRTIKYNVRKYYENGALMCEYNCKNAIFNQSMYEPLYHNQENLEDYYKKYDELGNLIKKVIIVKNGSNNCLKIRCQNYYGNRYLKSDYKNKKIIFY